MTGPILLEALWKTWQRVGLPDVAQMDNRTPAEVGATPGVTSVAVTPD